MEEGFFDNNIVNYSIDDCFGYLVQFYYTSALANKIYKQAKSFLSVDFRLIVMLPKIDETITPCYDAFNERFSVSKIPYFKYG